MYWVLLPNTHTYSHKFSYKTSPVLKTRFNSMPNTEMCVSKADDLKRASNLNFTEPLKLISLSGPKAWHLEYIVHFSMGPVPLDVNTCSLVAFIFRVCKGKG